MVRQVSVEAEDEIEGQIKVTKPSPKEPQQPPKAKERPKTFDRTTSTIDKTSQETSFSSKYLTAVRIPLVILKGKWKGLKCKVLRVTVALFGQI